MHEHKRGKIRDNALKALVTSPLYKTRTERKVTGKGSYTRKQKHKCRKWGAVLKNLLMRVF